MKKTTVFLTSLCLSLFVLFSCGGGGDGGGGGGDDDGDDDEGDESAVFQSEFTITPDGVFTGESGEVTAKVAIKRTSDITIDTVTLVEVDSSGTETGELATMLDNGSTSNGDDISTDNIYAGIATLSESATGTIYVAVRVEYTEGDTSKTVTTDSQQIASMTRFTSTEWDAMTNTPDEVATYMATNGATATATYLNNGGDADVVIAGVSEENTTRSAVWFVYKNGILGGVIFNETETPTATALGSTVEEPPTTDETVTTGVLAAKGGGTSRYSGESEDTGLIGSRPLEMYPSPTSSRFIRAETVDPDAVESKSAILLSPYYWQFRGTDDFWGAWRPIRESECPKFDLTKKFNMTRNAQNITPEDFKTLSNYGVVVISTHGDSWYNGLFTWWDDYFGVDASSDPKKFNWLADSSSTVILLTGLKLTAANRATYEADLQQHRLAVTRSGTLAITPAFITAYNGTFPSSVVWLGACRSTYKNKMCNAFINKGARTCVGFSDYVNSGYCRDIGKNFFGADKGSTAATTDDGLLDLSPTATSASTARTTSTGNWGANDKVYDATDTDAASFDLFGDNDTNLNVSAINNGGFEEGSAIGWFSDGDFRAQAYVGSVGAQEGTYMGVISTGLGATSVTEGEGSTFQQSMCVPADVSTISFRYDVITEEAMCYVGSSFDDTFQVLLIDKNGAELAQSPGVMETVNSSSWSFLGGDYFAGGDSYATPQSCEDSYSDGTYHTGWKSGSIDVSSYAGSNTPITLKFNVWDEGDSAWDTAVTIDDVKVD